MHMIELGWSDFKQVIDAQLLNYQYFNINNTYHIYACNGPIVVLCKIYKDNNADQTDFENNYQSAANNAFITNARTRDERNDISMKLCRVSGTTSSGEVTLEIKVPGTPGVDKGREIEGGNAFFGTFTAGDHIKEINVVDKDNLLGYGAGVIVKKWHDVAVTNYQATGMWILPGYVSITSMGDWGQVPSGFYIQIKAVKASGEDTFYVNIIWGEPS